jgi:hypothetical protein
MYYGSVSLDMIEVDSILEQAGDVSVVDFVKHLVSGLAGIHQPQASPAGQVV